MPGSCHLVCTMLGPERCRIRIKVKAVVETGAHHCVLHELYTNSVPSLPLGLFPDILTVLHAFKTHLANRLVSPLNRLGN